MSQHQPQKSPAVTESEERQTSERNRDVVRHLLEVWSRHDFDLLDGILTDDFAWHGGSFGEVSGRETFKPLAESFTTSFPDLAIEVHDVIAEGGLVMARNTVTGTHRAEFMGVPATGKHLSWNEHSVYRLVDGKIVEGWWVADMFGLMRQLGTLPNG